MAYSFAEVNTGSGIKLKTDTIAGIEIPLSKGVWGAEGAFYEVNEGTPFPVQSEDFIGWAKMGSSVTGNWPIVPYGFRVACPGGAGIDVVPATSGKIRHVVGLQFTSDTATQVDFRAGTSTTFWDNDVQADTPHILPYCGQRYSIAITNQAVRVYSGAAASIAGNILYIEIDG